MVQSHLVTGTNVPPWGHIGATWWIRLNLCFLSPTWVHNPNGKSIGSTIFAQPMAKCRQACPGMSFPLIIATSHWESGTHLIHASLSPPESITKMTSRLVQPLLHSLWQNAATLYKGPPLFSPIITLPMGILTLFNTIPWAHLNPQPKQHLDCFSHFCTAH